jgi:exosortase family protein XrtF
MSDSTRSVLLFLAKALAVYGVWYVVYDLWLLPDGRLDTWLSRNVTAVSGGLLQVMGFDAVVNGRTLYLPGAAGVRLIDGCNGLTTIGLFAGFILAFPGRHILRALYLPIGIGVIYVSNVLRVTALTLFQKTWPAAFDVVHDLGATSFFYLIVFGLWVVWAQYGDRPLLAQPSDAERTAPSPA